MILLPLVAWAAATGAHFGLTAVAATRVLARDEVSLDERLFVSVLAGIASLSIVLHLAATTVGLGLVSGLAGLALWHAGLWAIIARKAPRAGAEVGRLTAGRPTILEALALAVFAGIVLTWCAVAMESIEVAGPDAAHYHVPAALNLATGANLFDLPATPHLYPLTGSLISAWFIVPLGDPLIVDLAMVLPCVLLVTSLNLLFRCATGLSGTAWASWLALMLFATPMFRTSSEGSADLWFAAGFISALAVLMWAWTRGAWSVLRVGLAGCAFGLLVGSKATGLPAAVLLIGAAVVLEVVRRVAGGAAIARPRRPWLALAAAASVCLGAGGIWLVRNWLHFGSPMAPAGLSIGGLTVFAGEPFERSTYLSVLAEMNSESFHLWPSAQRYIGQWFGAGFLFALWPIGLLAFDLIAAARTRGSDRRWWPRLGMFFIIASVGAALIWLLIGAPWTGLERSGGLALRYALPVAAGLALLAFIGCFPLGRAWYGQPRLRAGAGLVLVVGSAALFYMSLRPAGPGTIFGPMPALRGLWLVIALVAVAALTRTPRPLSVAWTRVSLVAAFGLLLIWWVPATANADHRVREQRQSALEAEELALAGGVKPAGRWREVFLAVRAAEHATGQRCVGQRFYALTRFDEPMALQPPGFGNKVFYAGRDLASAQRGGPLAACDYVITTPALEETQKGAALDAALAGPRHLERFASTPSFVVLTLVRER